MDQQRDREKSSCGLVEASLRVGGGMYFISASPFLCSHGNLTLGSAVTLNTVELG